MLRDGADAAQKKLMYRLYVSHIASTWGDNMWAFAITLFLLDVWGNSVQRAWLWMASADARQYLLVAIYGLVTDLAVVLFGAHAGRPL